MFYYHIVQLNQMKDLSFKQNETMDILLEIFAIIYVIYSYLRYFLLSFLITL